MEPLTIYRYAYVCMYKSYQDHFKAWMDWVVWKQILFVWYHYLWISGQWYAKVWEEMWYNADSRTIVFCVQYYLTKGTDHHYHSYVLELSTTYGLVNADENN